MIDLRKRKSFNFTEGQKKSVKSGSTSSLENEVRCFTSVSNEAFAKKKSKRCRLPPVDPQISEHWHQVAMQPMELLSYTLGVFNDLLPRDLADCWTQQLGRRVELAEKANVTAQFDTFLHVACEYCMFIFS